VKTNGKREGQVTGKRGAGLKRSELEIYQKIYIECHNLFITFAPKQGTEQDYMDLVLASESSRCKVEDHPFWFKMLALTQDEIEKIWKGRRRQE
jgi:hypothetical protein